MIIGSKHFDVDNHCYVMGILNVTPDSFSDGGQWNTVDRALFRAEQMLREGADILDIGGESTRPGHQKISDEAELARIYPVIEAISARFDSPLSVDTYKSGVAQGAIEAGATLVNDIWGLKWDPDLAGIIAQSGVCCCLMHNRGDENYVHFETDFLADMRESLAIAEKAGIGRDKIILDPGVGFAKTHAMNLSVINHLDVLASLGYPVLLGASRKRVVGLALDLPVDERLEGTLATTVVAVMRGCSFVRVHDVKENKRVIRMTEAILGKS